MSILDKISKTRTLAPRITIYGKPGIGKSTLASQFPDPLFLLTEHSALTGIDALPIATSFIEVWENIKSLLALNEIPFKTLVIDSISKLDGLIVKHILDEETNKKINTLGAACGGYGKGYERCQFIHRAFKAKCDEFMCRGIAVVYIGHAVATKYKSPEYDDYDIFNIVMNHDKSREVYIDDVDAVLFCKLQSYVDHTQSGRALIKSSNSRIMITGVNDGFVSKNRYKLPFELPMSFDDLAKNIPFYQENNNE